MQQHKCKISHASFLVMVIAGENDRCFTVDGDETLLGGGGMVLGGGGMVLGGGGMVLGDDGAGRW